jgi:hypothetical protein
MNGDWLAQLAPAHAPPPPGWWPPAPGWWGLALLLAAALGVLLYRLNWPPRRLRRAALRELEQIETRVFDESHLARELENLLRRYAVARFGRAAVAGLSGANWIDFVVAHGGGDWAGATGQDLLRIAYGGSARQAPADHTRWLNGARAFIEGSSRGRPGKPG